MPGHTVCPVLQPLSKIHRRRRRRHLANTELGHLLTCSGLTLLQVSLMVSPGFFCLLVCSLLLSSVIYYEAFLLCVATNFFICVRVFCPTLGLYLVLLQSLGLFYNMSKCILMFFSCISNLLLLLFLRLSLLWSSFHYRITARRATVWYSIIIVFSKAFSDLNISFSISYSV